MKHQDRGLRSCCRILLVDVGQRNDFDSCPSLEESQGPGLCMGRSFQEPLCLAGCRLYLKCEEYGVKSSTVSTNSNKMRISLRELR